MEDCTVLCCSFLRSLHNRTATALRAPGVEQIVACRRWRCCLLLCCTVSGVLRLASDQAPVLYCMRSELRPLCFVCVGRRALSCCTPLQHA